MSKHGQKQSQKQTVNVKVHIAETRKKKKRRNKQRSSGGGGGNTTNPYPVQPYHPVFISSSFQTPTEPANPLLTAIQELNTNMTKKHEDKVENPLLKTVPEKGHISGKPLADKRMDGYDFVNENPMHSAAPIYVEPSDIDSIPPPTPARRRGRPKGSRNRPKLYKNID